MSKILSDHLVDIVELQKSPSKILNEANGHAVAIMDGDKACAYLVPKVLYENIMEMIDDVQLSKDIEVALKSNEQSIDVNIDEI